MLNLYTKTSEGMYINITKQFREKAVKSLTAIMWSCNNCIYELSQAVYHKKVNITFNKLTN